MEILKLYKLESKKLLLAIGLTSANLQELHAPVFQLFSEHEQIIRILTIKGGSTLIHINVKIYYIRDVSAN